MKEKIFECPLYKNHDIIILIGDLSKISKKYDFLEDDGNDLAFTQQCLINNNKSIIIAMNPKHSEFTLGIAAHECLHAVNMIFDTIGVIPTFDNDEPQAYLLEYLLNEVYPLIKKYI